MRKFSDSFKYAISGIKFVVVNQRNFRIQLAIGAAVLVGSIIFDFSATEILWLTFAVFFVLMGEAVNTLIEEIMNVIHPEYSKHVKNVKDAAAGVVLISSVFAVSVGVVVMGSHFFNWKPQVGAIIALVFVAFSVTLGVIGGIINGRRKDKGTDSR